jgi:hypothetical protein
VSGNVGGRAPTPPRPTADPDDVAAYLAEQKRLSRRQNRPASADSGFVRLSTVTPKQVQWLWRGYIPAGKITVLDGDPGIGKSALAVDFAARITAGRLWPDGAACRPGNVLMMTAEEDLADTLRPRVEAQGGNPEKVIVLTHIPGADGTRRLPSLPTDIPYIEDGIREHRARLLTIDVLSSYLGSEVDAHRDAAVRRVLHPLHEMARRTRCAVLLLRHLNKAATVGNAMYRGMGSIGITGQARAVYLAAASPDDPSGSRRILAPVKMNCGKMPPALAYLMAEDETHQTVRIEWLGEDPHTAAKLLAEPLSAQARADRDEVVWLIIDYLKNNGGEAPFRDIRDAAAKHGIPVSTLKAARERAGVTFKRRGYAEGSVWRLPEDELPFPIEPIGTATTGAVPMSPMAAETAEA